MPARLALLFALYFAQGLPFGFQAAALPVYLRETGVSLTGIGLASALALPWMLKALWAPVVDRYHWRDFGRRRSWIIPMQLALAATCAAAAHTEPATSLTALLVLVLAMNLFAATMDIAVDGLAIDSLRTEHLGYGNIAQVVGYKAGMITSGGLLLAITDTVGWTGIFAIMTALVCAVAVVTLLFREPDAAPGEPGDSAASFGSILAIIGRALVTPAARWTLLVIATYKFGESVADALFRPFLYDAGFTKAQIGVWVGTWGMLASIAGSIAGGVLASRIGLVRALAVTAALRALPVFGEWWLTMTTPSADAVIAVTVAEHCFGGALTTAMFAFMMSRVDRRIGATHYTVLATVEVLGKSGSGLLSGAFADATSYPTAFGAAAFLSLAFLALLVPLARALANSRDTHADKRAVTEATRPG